VGVSLRGDLGRLFGGSAVHVEGVPEADLVIAPKSVDEVARVLDFASEHRLAVLPWGAGSHQGLGRRIDPDIVLVTTGLDRIEDWQPDDLTVVADAGVTLGALEDLMVDRRQSAVLPEDQPEATVGGVVAAGISGWRRLRYGPTRDRMLEATVVTGDGRIVRAGGRVVKNVTGYDIPRLMAGSLGSLGVIVSVCLKLWPDPEATVTVTVDDAERALAVAFRPYAVLQTPNATTVHLGGTRAEVESQAAALGGRVTDGFAWPERPTGQCLVSLRVPPALVTEAVRRIGDAPFVASHGVGEVVAAVAEDGLLDLRIWAESIGGALVFTDAPDGLYGRIDPWGTPPATVALQRRIKAAFDPVGVMAPGRLPGGV
jgi:glycolate oxidase FAD binding subunit